MKKVRWLSILNLLVFLVHLGISYSTQFKLLNNKDVGEVSDGNPSLFTPAGFTFSIWGVIYFSLLCFTVYHLVMSYKQPTNHPSNQDLLKINGWFIFNNLTTAAWLIVWTNEMLGLSVLLIVMQLISLIIVNVRLNIYDRSRELTSKAFTQFPLSIYFAWLSIATIANISSWLSDLNWTGGLSAVVWTQIMIGAAVLITLAVIVTRHNGFYGMVVIWALYGIWAGRSADTNVNGEPIMSVALAGISLVAVTTIIQLVRNARTNKQQINYQVT
jgi:hypothetical protein